MRIPKLQPRISNLYSKQACGKTVLLEIIPTAAVASTVMDIVECTERISEAVHEPASLAHFKRIDPILTPEEP